MKKEEILTKINDLDDNIDITEETLGFAKPTFDYNAIDIDQFKDLLKNNPTIKGYWTSEKDRAVSKGVNTFKENNLTKLVEEELKKRSEEGLTDEQKQLRELQAKLDAYEKEQKLRETKGEYKKVFEEQGLSIDLMDFIDFNKDRALIETDIKKLGEVINKITTNKVQQLVNNNNPIPPKSTGTPQDDDELTVELRKLHPNLF